ncbi:hypothetical protein B0H34DRAFT_670724 [Crassisporium funariophilum]|nr:hypothetical protein B0H34DRAFT_670724 [Crassisporium funariophilum]
MSCKLFCVSCPISLSYGFLYYKISESAMKVESHDWRSLLPGLPNAAPTQRNRDYTVPVCLSACEVNGINQGLTALQNTYSNVYRASYCSKFAPVNRTDLTRTMVNGQCHGQENGQTLLDLLPPSSLPGSWPKIIKPAHARQDQRPHGRRHGVVDSAKKVRHLLDTKGWILEGKPYNRTKLVQLLMTAALCLSTKSPDPKPDIRNIIVSIAFLLEDDITDNVSDTLADAVVTKTLAWIEAVTARLTDTAKFIAASNSTQAKATLAIKNASDHLSNSV